MLTQSHRNRVQLSSVFFFYNGPNGSTANFTVCTSYWLNLMSQIILFAVHVKQAQQNVTLQI